MRRSRLFETTGSLICALASIVASQTLLADELDVEQKSGAGRAGLDWWSLQPVERPAVPAIGKNEPSSSAIDAFVLAKLDAAGITPAPTADKQILIRRAYFDLIGLPPTPEQIDAFVSDDSPRAWENLIDELLQSKAYGERWARYWLDVVRFAETCGYERDQMKPGIWRYRDWVIKALNDDMPYDRFVTLQIAGDEVPERDESTVIATAMLRAGTWNDEPNDPADYVYERLEDMVHTTTTAFLALTVKCARCHDHKFDPVKQTDYYRIANFFWAGYIGQANLGGPTAEELGFDVFGWTDRGATAEPLHLLLGGERHRPGPVVPPGFLSAIAALDRPLTSAPVGSRTTRRRIQLAEWITDPRNPLTARVIVNRLWLHHFGEGLVRTPDNFGFKGDVPTHTKLLDWLAAELVTPSLNDEGTAAHAYGASWSLKRMHKLIMTSDTYRQSSVHPLNSTYAAMDPQNLLWWRFSRRRLDAEALRDALLAVSGRLNRKMGGPSFFPHMSGEALEGLSRKEGAWQESPADERARRSIYMMTKRSRLLPLMTAFDFQDTTLPCGRRDVTLSPPQALTLLNNHFVHEQSRALAQRLDMEAGCDMRPRIDRAWRIAFGRQPHADEMQAAAEHVRELKEHFATVARKRPRSENEAERLAWESLCHVLLNANEFLFVD